MSEYKLKGYSVLTCPVCNGTGNDPKYRETRFQNPFAYCPRCSGNGTIQIQHYEETHDNP